MKYNVEQMLLIQYRRQRQLFLSSASYRLNYVKELTSYYRASSSGLGGMGLFTESRRLFFNHCCLRNSYSSRCRSKKLSAMSLFIIEIPPCDDGNFMLFLCIELGVNNANLYRAIGIVFSTYKTCVAH